MDRTAGEVRKCNRGMNEISFPEETFAKHFRITSILERFLIVSKVIHVCFGFPLPRFVIG